MLAYDEVKWLIMMKNDNTEPNKTIVKQKVLTFDFTTHMLFRCMQRQYAEMFCNGEIHFGCPREWIEIEKNGNKGQGDVLEGVFLSTEGNDSSDNIKRLKNNQSIDHFASNGQMFFRRKSLLELQCLCLYGLHDNSFHKEISHDGRAHYYSIVPKDYFSCFSEYKDRDAYKLVKPEVQPVVVFINNPEVFFSRIRCFLKSLGVKDSEIIISPVEYVDRYIPSFTNIPYPMELLLKDKTFEKQSEVRIIVNSNCKNYLDYMRSHNNTLQIGSIEDITEIYDYYFDDMRVERYGSRHAMINLPESISFQIQDLDFLELYDLLLNIIDGHVKIENAPEGCSTWQEKLTPIIDLFYSKYGVVVNVSEDNRVFLYNMNDNLRKKLDEKYKDDILLDSFKRRIEQLVEKGLLQEAAEECYAYEGDQLCAGASAYYLGGIFSTEKKFQEAICAYLRAYALDFKRIESLDKIAAIYFNQGKYSKAIEVYNSIQEEKGYDCKIYCNIGLCYYRLEEYDKSIEYYDKGIELDKNDALPYYNKGVTFFKLKQFDKAKECMKKAIELDSQNEIYKREYGRCFSNEETI